MDLVRMIQLELQDHRIDNTIYLFDETETDCYEETKNMVKGNYDFFDIVPDLSDYGKLKEQIDKLDPSLRCSAVKDYLLYKIFIAANIDKEFYEEQIKKQFDGDFITECVDILLDYANGIKEKAKKEKNGYARVHFFLDDIDDIYLQEAINDLIYARCSIAVMCYTTKDLITCSTTSGGTDIIENSHDYRKIESRKRIKREFKVYFKKFERR